MSTMKKDSGARVIEMAFNTHLNLLAILSSDGKFELVKVNINNKESILKKLIRADKRKALKRKRDENIDHDLVKNIKVDKELLQA